MRAVEECDDLGIPDAKESRARRVGHDSKLALNVSHLKHLAAIDAQRAVVVFVTEI